VKQVRIAWKSTLTGYCGHGDWFPQHMLPVLAATRDSLNKLTTTCEHQLETEETEDQPQETQL
jgi:hypothetical protein